MDGVQTAMVSSTSQLLIEVSYIVISGVISMLGVYIRKFLVTNEYAKKYNLYNEKTERILTNAIMYAEANAKNLVTDQITKRHLAVSYIEKISPDIIAKEGDKLEMMLDRKVEQMFQKEVQVNRGIISNKDIAPALVTNTPTNPLPEPVKEVIPEPTQEQPKFYVDNNIIYDSNGNSIGIVGSVGPGGCIGQQC